MQSEETRRCNWCGDIATGDCGCDAEVEIKRLRSLLNEALYTMAHAKIFVCSRETMNPVGQQLYSDLLEGMQEEERRRS